MATSVAEDQRPPSGTNTPALAGPAWRVHWPLTVLFLGFPLWWALGLRTLFPIAVAFVMVWQLSRRPRIVLPRGFAFWALFLVWVLVGVLVLWVDAPGAVPGGGAARVLVFAYRAAWYFTATAFLLWVANLRESELPTRWLFQLMGSMFVVATVGGLAGVLAPTFEFTSLVEMLLPAGIRNEGIVQSIAHPAVADIQNVLGRPVPRPKAPFPFANSWGSAMALHLPFFLVAWWRDGARWQRIATPVVLTLAAVPVVFSLNRGLWICLALGAVGFLWLLFRTGRIAPVVAAAAVTVLAGVAFVASPLDTMVSERLANAHSNDRRSQLVNQTLVSTVTGSPVVGFGSTRDVQGSFSSIAGGDTADCGACGAPPLGTQGQLWLVIFSQGLVGALLFLAFFLVAFQRTWRCRTVVETTCTFVLVFFAFQLLIYDTLGIPLATVMVAIAAVWREQHPVPAVPPASSGPDATAVRAPARRRLVVGGALVAVTTVAGGALGAALAAQSPIGYATRVTVELNPIPVHLEGQGREGEATSGYQPADPTTVDTEAQLLLSDNNMVAALGPMSPSVQAQLRDALDVTAAPNTRTVSLEARATDPDASERIARSVVASYLETRRQQLSARREMALAEATTLPFAPLDLAGVPSRDDRAQRGLAVLREKPRLMVGAIAPTPTRVGEVVRVSGPRVIRRPPEVPIASGLALGLAVGATVVLAWRRVLSGRRSGRER